MVQQCTRWLDIFNEKRLTCFGSNATRLIGIVPVSLNYCQKEDVLKAMCESFTWEKVFFSIWEKIFIFSAKN